MSKIGLFYGTQTGKTEEIASMIQEQLGKDLVDTHDMSDDGYDFTESKGVRDGKLIGLALDEDNQGDLTESRIKTWSGQVKQAFGI